ncbi:MAG TPA: F0F1 ATP synthase subunit B [Dehalococcoidia bacterium]|nr:F0F1 ATP synthase subunit B [Dehalococcoidia bacterium]
MEGLGINLPQLIAQIVSFLVLFGLLYFFAYKPILRMFDERSQRIKESVEQAEKVKEEAAAAEEENRKKLETAAKEGQEAIARAMRAGDEARQRAQQEAQVEAAGLVEKARQEIQRERDEVIGELRQEFADLAVAAAEKVIEKSLDKEAHRELIEKVLDESTGLDKE